MATGANSAAVMCQKHLVAPLEELTHEFTRARQRFTTFWRELNQLLRDYCWPAYPVVSRAAAERHMPAAHRFILKREDLLHTGAHKINNALGTDPARAADGQKPRHRRNRCWPAWRRDGTVCALFGLRCVIYMGAEDMRRQALNVFRMRLLGAEVITVNAGTRTLKDAINEALRDWVTNVHDTYYLLGSALGPHPYPLMVREFQSVIGREAREQILSSDRKIAARC